MENLILNNVSLAYAWTQTPKKGNPDYEQPDHYAIDAVVNEDVADEFEEKFPQNKVRKVKTSEFAEKYKFDPPFPDEKNQYVITFKRKYLDGKTGEPLSYKKRPKVFVPVSPGSNDLEDVTRTVRIGNGSVGSIEYLSYEARGKQFHSLLNVRVDDLIEGPGGNTGTGLGNVQSSTGLGQADSGDDENDAEF